MPIFFLFKKNQDNIYNFFSKDDSNQAMLFEEFDDKQRGSNYLLFETHRGWLLHEAITGAKKNYFLGNGISTFRIRDTNYGSKTETHNDLALVLYETGILGLLFLIISIGVILIKSLKEYKKTKSFISSCIYIFIRTSFTYELH